MISKVNLFSELSLIKYNEKANDIISHLEQNPYYGNQFKIIHIDTKKLSV
jgi:hypothetical protein